jgi:hypothetical protein
MLLLSAVNPVRVQGVLIAIPMPHSDSEASESQ